MAAPTTNAITPDRAQPCPCGSGQPFGDCCAPVLGGQRLAATAEQLMRARFTAHVVHDFKFLHYTYRGTAKQPYTEVSADPAMQWTRLVVHRHELGASPEMALVDFSAYGTERGAEVVLHEKAEFARENGAWIYTRAVREGPAPFKSAAPKPGRNDPCPCGSGKKYKQCCLLKA
jgi:SEC-C motif-containing protein